MRRHLKVTGFLILLLGGGTAFLAVTGNNEGPGLLQRWTSSSSVRVSGSPDSVPRQISTIDLPGPKGKRLAFLSCEDNDLMTVFRLDTHQPIAYFPQAKGGDVIAFDPGLKRIYVACYDGAISVFQEDDPAHFRKLGDVPLQKKVHSLAIDLSNHRVYAPEQEENGAPVAKIAVFEVVPPS